MGYLWYGDYRKGQPRAEKSADEDLFISGRGHLAHHDDKEGERYTVDGDTGNDEGGQECLLR